MNEAAVCTAAGCYLAGKSSLLSLPIVTVAGLIDGINPCAIGMIVLLLGYLIVFANKPERVAKTAFVYILTVFLTYVVVGLFFFETIVKLQQTPFKTGFELLVGTALVFAAVINLKDFFAPQWGPHLQIPTASKAHLRRWVERTTLPAAIVLGVLVTLLETPCSLPLYVGTLTILANSGLSTFWIGAYFLYYNFLFILPLIVVTVVIWRGKNLIEMREWEEKSKRWMKLLLGASLLLMGAWLLRGLISLSL